MTPDEIGGRGDRDPLLPRAGRVAVALGVVVLTSLGVASALTGGPGGPASDPAPAPQPTTGSSDGRPVAGEAADDLVTVSSVCPVASSGFGRLTVRFLLANASTRPLTIHSVRPVLALGGLRARGTWVGGGDCHRLAPQVAGPVPPGGRRLVLMSFRLPAGCPAPVSVAAQVLLGREAHGTRTVDVPSLVVLTAADFDTC